MVNPSILFGLAPLAGVASAIYIPHESDSVFLTVHSDASPSEVSDKASAHAAQAVKDVKPKKHHGCRGKASKKSKKTHRKHHPAEVVAAQKKDKDVATQVVPSSSLHQINGIFIQSANEVIPDQYIVLLKDGKTAKDSLTSLNLLAQGVVQELLQTGETHSLIEGESATGFEITHIYDKLGVQGYAGKMLPQIAEILAQHPDVAIVEADSKVHVLNPTEEDQAPWGLARVSHRDPLGLGTYNKYLYDGEGGEGVTSYIVDTGIYVDHKDFQGRAVWGKTMPAGDSDIDAHGHGSHCAGTIGGNKYGVAKKAKLVAVKVLGSDGSGSMSDVIGGVEYVVESHRKEKKEKGGKLKGSTANMSLGGGKSPALDIAVNAAVEAGVHFAVAAGNENQDACNSSPAGASGPVTVGATQVNDNRAYFSNWGKCVDIFAPGVNVLSVGTTSPGSTAVMSGTSMASPHIAGLLTYFVSLQPSTDSQYSTRGDISTKELKKYLISFGTEGVITDLDSDSPNVLAYNGGGKELSSFWKGESEDNSEKKTSKSFFQNVGEIFEDLVEEVEESVHDLF